MTFPSFTLRHATCKSPFIISESDSLTHLDSVRGDQIASRRPSESIMQVPAGVPYQECPTFLCNRLFSHAMFPKLVVTVSQHFKNKSRRLN
jgi:hypothetical protein